MVEEYSLKNVIYFHGFNSGPSLDNPKVKLFIEFGLNVFLVDARPGYGPRCYMSSAEKIVSENSLTPLDTIFVGSSLGGFWARELAFRMGKFPFIAFNPVINPSRTLEQTGGPVLSYEGISITKVCPDLEGLIILSNSDPVIDSSETEKLFHDKHWVWVMNSDDHRAQDVGKYTDVIKKFIRIVSAF